MAKGSPDCQHELMVTGLTRCLKQSYPSAEFSFGTKIDLGLKPDLFVIHPDGRRWAYEMINKHAHIGHVELKQQQYAQAGVQVYWILWETLAPGRPLDVNKVTRQWIWASDELLQRRRRYQLNKLQRTLARLGEGYLYIFALDKPLLDQVEHWMLKLFFIGLDIYHIPSDQLQADRGEGEWNFVPLPYLIFDPLGRPQLKPGAGEFSDTVASAIESMLQIQVNRPILLKEAMQNMDQLLNSSDGLAALIRPALEAVLTERATIYSQVEIQRALKQMRVATEQIKTKPAAPVSDVGQVLQVLNEYITSLPPLFRDAFQEVLPLPTESEIHLILELKQWLEADPHLQALIMKI